jgi:hypothetical protein
MNSARRLLFAFVTLLCATTAQAQFEIQGAATNLLDGRRAGASAEISGGEVSVITVHGGGAYTAVPAVVLAAPPSGTTATAVAVVSDGKVSAINVTNPGAGYTSPPAVYIAPPQTPVGLPVTTRQFAGVASTSATAGAIGTAAGEVYPSARDITQAAVPVVTIVLREATFGYSFASGVPLYFMGDEIQRPLVRWDGTPENPSYWRAKPVQAGENFDDVYLANLVGASQPLLPQVMVTVTASDTASATVTVSAVPPELTAGASLLGQRVNRVSGTTITLAGNANRTISAATPEPFSRYQPYYYSPHADKVFASQAGRVALTWVSAAPDTSAPNEVDPTYKFRTETFAVSSASRAPARTIYWTEKSFDGPLVNIPTGRITRVNPVFNSFVPGMTTEYVPVGSNPNPATSGPAEPRTLWFDDLNGFAALHAYNIEGRIFIEYLGAQLQGAGGNHVFLGADIVDIRRVAESATIETKLGEKLRPRQEAAANGDDQLIPKLVLDFGQGITPYGSFYRADGITEYSAERESLDPDRIKLYWLETLDAGIYFLEPPSAPGLSINWPKLKRSYTQVWPSAIAEYEPVNVNDTGATVDTGLQFSASNLPQIVFQDDPAAVEAEIDAASQRLLVNFSNSADKTNRSLLKFNSSSGPWYVRLYIQSSEKLGSSEDGAPPVYTLNDLNGDGIRDWSSDEIAGPTEGLPGGRVSATVGGRIDAPSSAYATAGYVASGRSYSEAAYSNPLAVGFDAAAAGGIIPVNALATDNQLTVWWFKEVIAPSNKFASFYVPAIAARYRVSYPENPDEIVIASGEGIDSDLTSEQADGSIYVQNDPTKIGYNPNEEHALMLTGNAYALRDDLNTATSSEPFVLIQYTEASTGRPAMRVASVIRENDTYPFSYDSIAGNPSQPPMPLTALPLPIRDMTLEELEQAAFSNVSRLALGLAPLPGGKVVANTEVDVAADTAVGSGAPGYYEKFTFTDRKGFHWIYRGPHNGGTPSFGMKFYYYLQEGFWFPGLDAASQPAVGSIQPYVADVGDGTSVTLTYFPKWPDDPSLAPAEQEVLGEMQTAQTLTLAKDGLPQVRGQSSAQVLYQQSIANTGSANPAVALHDPTRQKTIGLDAAGVGLDGIPGSVLTTPYAGKIYFQNLPPNLQNRFYFDPNLGPKGSLVLAGEFVDVPIGEDYLELNQLGPADVADLSGDIGALKALCPAADTANRTKWNAAIEGLSTKLETFRESTTVPGSYVALPSLDRNIGLRERADITEPDTAVDSYALSSTGLGTGYVTLVFNNGEAFTDEGNPVDVQIIKVSPDLYQGDAKALLASNPLDEQVVLRHSGDYGGQLENFEFEWRYGFPDDGFPPANTGFGPGWFNPRPDLELSNSVLVGGSPAALISTPAILMADTWFTMRYQKKKAAPEDPDAWSEWVEPVRVDGWVKRVLGKITPFNQRMEDLYNNSVNTDVSLLTQAGQRWEGNIALNLENINDAGLIEIYETVLNRAKSFTIGSGIDFAASNDALILAAGYLSDLYTILGNEAYADAANPTISIDDQDTVTEVNTSRFSFEGQVASSLDEELALLRGRDDFGLPSTGLAPAYNRLFWNYTRGINSGEVLYAVNYNIKEKTGSSSADGKVDAADALRMFPQGHGDAYGHYLTALTGYYKVLTHPDFTWIPSAEAVTVLGQSVLVDYKDERKFAAAAGNLARTSQQVFSLVQRQSYNEDPAAGWSHLRDGKLNSRTEVTRHQGLDETASRSAQGSFYHWITGNALLPDVDTNPNHTGVQIVDRTTVPELNELVTASESFQSGMDLANAHLNPLGLSPGAIAFDISPAEHKAGNSHFEQINARALRAVLNAKGSFDQAAKMTRLLRNQENQIADRQDAIFDQELAYVNQLTEIYGKPYAGDIGPGKTYAQGYVGPDLDRWFIVDRPTDLVDTTSPVTITINVPTGSRSFTGDTHSDIINTYNRELTQKTFQVTPDRFMQFSDVIGSSSSLGSRPMTGELQKALMDSYLAQVALREANAAYRAKLQLFRQQAVLFDEMVRTHTTMVETRGTENIKINALRTSGAALVALSEFLVTDAQIIGNLADSAEEAMRSVNGFSNDVTSGPRAALQFSATVTAAAFTKGGIIALAAGKLLEIGAAFTEANLTLTLEELGFDQSKRQVAYELEVSYRELINEHYVLAARAADLQTAKQNISNLSTLGQRLLTERETFRQRAAAIITGYRTKDLTFRTFRNEALEQYRTLFDLASRYTYLAAKSYDYETGLLGTPAGNAVINRIVASRSLGDLTGGVPQATVSTLGDAGLAGTMAQMNADFSVAEGRLGINNADQYGTLFSLRHELYRILDDPAQVDDDNAWQQALQQNIVPNLLADADVARYCNSIRKPDGSNVPGIIIPFSTTINHTDNYFGLPAAAGDHAFSPSSYATKISSVGIVLPGYVGMDPYSIGTPDAGSPDSSDANALRATPYVYFIPCGNDYMYAPPLGDTNTVRSWTVHDQALPLPYNLGASSFNTTQFFTSSGTLTEQPWILRKHQAFRPVSDPAFFYSNIPAEFTNSRLIGRSVWNGQWKIVIPAYTLLADEQEGLTRFVKSVKDIKLFLRTYSHSGN